MRDREYGLSSHGIEQPGRTIDDQRRLAIVSIPLDLQSTLAADPEILGGAVRFKATRVPVQALLDTIVAGENLDYFLDDFPDVTKTQALAVLNWESNETRKVFGLELVA